MSSYLRRMFPPCPVQPGTQGLWSVTVEHLDERTAGMANLGLMPGREIPAGTYHFLRRGKVVVMSSTPAELYDHVKPVERATGHCLINGLGLGIVLGAVLAKPTVTAVTVVEQSADVIKLVAPYYPDPRVRVVHASAYDYRPPGGVRYGMVWHDIWDNICTDNLPEMAKLHRKYGRRCDWQGSWARGLCQHYRRRERASRW